MLLLIICSIILTNYIVSCSTTFMEFQLLMNSTLTITGSDIYESNEISNATINTLILMLNTTESKDIHNSLIIQTYNTSSTMFETIVQYSTRIDAQDNDILDIYQQILNNNQDIFNKYLKMFLNCNKFESTKFIFGVYDTNQIYTTKTGSPILVTNQLKINFTMNIASQYTYTKQNLIIAVIAGLQNTIGTIVEANYIYVIATTVNHTQFKMVTTLDATSYENAKDYERNLNWDTFGDELTNILRANKIILTARVVDIVDVPVNNTDTNKNDKTLIWFLVGSGLCAGFALIVIICWRNCTEQQTNNNNDKEAIHLQYLLDTNDNDMNAAINKESKIGINDGATKNLWASPMHVDEDELMDDYDKIKNTNPNIDNEINTNDIDNDIKKMNYNPPKFNDKQRVSEEFSNKEIDKNTIIKEEDILLDDDIDNVNSMPKENKDKQIFSRLSEDVLDNNNNDNNDDDDERDNIESNNNTIIENNIEINSDGDIEDIIQNVDANDIAPEVDDEFLIKPEENESAQFSRID